MCIKLYNSMGYRHPVRLREVYRTIIQDVGI